MSKYERNIIPMTCEEEDEHQRMIADLTFEEAIKSFYENFDFRLLKSHNDDKAYRHVTFSRFR